MQTNPGPSSLGDVSTNHTGGPRMAAGASASHGPLAHSSSALLLSAGAAWIASLSCACTCACCVLLTLARAPRILVPRRELGCSRRSCCAHARVQSRSGRRPAEGATHRTCRNMHDASSRHEAPRTSTEAQIIDFSEVRPPYHQSCQDCCGGSSGLGPPTALVGGSRS